MPTTLTNGIQLPDKGSVDWYNSMQSNYNLIDTHLGNTDIHVTAEDKANWNSKQGSLSQAQLDAIAQVSTNTSDIATLQSGKANASHTHSSSDITDIGDYATKQYVDNSISGLVDSAPNALDTLNELAAALNDDANFASTVATALGAKANSADLATVATSGDYNDLSNKPSIPTKTSDLNNDSGFVTLNDFDIPSKTSDLTNDSGFITSSDVPTSTSDLINDSNFVDTSNSAVSSGITSAKVTSYDSHIADTDIHVTTADKTKWNNGVTQSYVFRYSSSSVTDNSTIAYSTLDNTDNVKTGDKVIDVDGKIFSVVSVDTTNQTVTVGTALIDLALDANVVHNSGNETISGDKVFNNRLIKNIDVVLGTAPSTGKYSNIEITDNNKIGLVQVMGGVYDTGNSYVRFFVQNKTADDGTGLSPTGTLRTCGFNINLPATSTSEGQGSITPRANKATDFGLLSYQWRNLWCEKLFLNGTQLDPSAFVTTDTNQTITEIKTFTNTIKSQKEIEFTGNRLAYILPEFSASYSGLSLCTYGSSGAVKLGTWKVDDNDNTKHVLDTSLGYLNVTTGSVNSVNIVYLTPRNTTDSKLGDSTNKWKEINGLTPSSLSLPVIDRTKYVDISGYFTNTANGGINQYTAVANGFIYLKVSDVVTMHMMSLGSDTLSNYADTKGRNSAGLLYGLFPVRKGDVFTCEWYTTTTNVILNNAYFVPCQGNI